VFQEIKGGNGIEAAVREWDGMRREIGAPDLTRGIGTAREIHPIEFVAFVGIARHIAAAEVKVPSHLEDR
jgi:hypothetical protein